MVILKRKKAREKIREKAKEKERKVQKRNSRDRGHRKAVMLIDKEGETHPGWRLLH